MANPPTDRMGGFLVRYWKGIRHLFVVVTCIVSFGLPLQALVSTEDGMWQELAVTELGQYLPDTSITWETFVCASVRFLTFEKADVPLAIAKKHGYLPTGDMSEQITYKEAIDFVLRLIGAEADGAQSLGIMDYPFHPKQTVSIAQAGELLAREDWLGIQSWSPNHRKNLFVPPIIISLRLPLGFPRTKQSWFLTQLGFLRWWN